jgi:hypothetical protein
MPGKSKTGLREVREDEATNGVCSCLPNECMKARRISFDDTLKGILLDPRRLLL